MLTAAAIAGLFVEPKLHHLQRGVNENLAIDIVVAIDFDIGHEVDRTACRLLRMNIRMIEAR